VAALFEGVSLKYLRKLKADNFGRHKSRYNLAQVETVPLPAVAASSCAPSTKLPGTTNTFKAGLIVRRQEWQHQHKVSYAKQEDLLKGAHEVLYRKEFDQKLESPPECTPT
jgi:hypothetical protein